MTTRTPHQEEDKIIQNHRKAEGAIAMAMHLPPPPTRTRDPNFSTAIKAITATSVATTVPRLLEVINPQMMELEKI